MSTTSLSFVGLEEISLRVGFLGFTVILVLINIMQRGKDYKWTFFSIILLCVDQNRDQYHHHAQRQRLQMDRAESDEPETKAVSELSERIAIEESSSSSSALSSKALSSSSP